MLQIWFQLKDLIIGKCKFLCTFVMVSCCVRYFLLQNFLQICLIYSGCCNGCLCNIYASVFSTLLNIGYKSSLSVQQAIDSFYIDFSNMQQCAASAAAIFFPFQVMLLCKVLCNSVVKIKIRTVCCNQKTMLHTYCKMELRNHFWYILNYKIYAQKIHHISFSLSAAFLFDMLQIWSNVLQVLQQSFLLTFLEV